MLQMEHVCGAAAATAQDVKALALDEWVGAHVRSLAALYGYGDFDSLEGVRTAAVQGLRFVDCY